MGVHVAAVASRVVQSLFVLRTLKSHGLYDMALHCMCTAILVSRLIYALPAWFGFASELNVGRIQSVQGRAARQGLAGSHSLPTLTELAARSDQVLFKSATSNPLHILHQFLPPLVFHSHNLRRRPHNFILPKSTTLRSHNYLHRMLYKDYH